MTVAVTRVNHQEKRYFPREFAGLTVRWKRLTGSSVDALIAAWRRGLSEVGEDDWNSPEPFMNFSASGLRFRDAAECLEGDVLLVSLRLPGEDRWHRATASVVRRIESADGTAEIAVAFRDIDAASVEALADYTLDRQLAELARHQSEPDA